MRPDTIGREIRTEWADLDKINMGNSLALMLVELDRIQTEKKVADSEYNKKITTIKAETGALSRKMEKGYAIETITCDIRYNDPTPGQKSFYRMDTSACVVTEEMTWEEKQEELQFNIPKDTPQGDDAESQVGKVDESLCPCHNVLKANCPDNYPGAKSKKKGKGN